MTSYWQFWLTLGVMLYVGWIFHVGCFLGQFGSAALFTCGMAILDIFPDLEDQLCFFLFGALVFTILTLMLRRKHLSTTYKGSKPIT